jgi:hypothetical protein
MATCSDAAVDYNFARDAMLKRFCSDLLDLIIRLQNKHKQKETLNKVQQGLEPLSLILSNATIPVTKSIWKYVSHDSIP